MSTDVHETDFANRLGQPQADRRGSARNEDFDIWDIYDVEVFVSRCYPLCDECDIAVSLPIARGLA